MSEENLEQQEHQPAPPPAVSQRLAIMKDIAANSFAQHEKESVESASIPVVDEENRPVAATPEPAPAPPPEQASTPSDAPSSPSEPEVSAGAPLDPEAEYEVIVEGQPLKVKGSTIIDAGKRTLQKEAAAEHRLRLATQLLEEAERRAAATPQGATPAPEAPKQQTEAELAHALQFGTPEESAAAVRALRGDGFSEEKILRLTEERARLVAADEFEFRRGQALLAKEYKDLMEKPALRRLFESEDARLLQAGDRRPYVERYRAIGEQLRKDFGVAKPAAPAPAGAPAPGTAPARQAAKAAAPSVPRTAAARLGDSSSAPAKPVTPSDVIASMAASRGKNTLSGPLKRS